MRPSRRALTFGLSAVAALASWPVTAGVTAQDRWIGKANAPVTVFEYASVTCPHCGRWNAEVWPAFKAKYVDTGKVRFVLRELPTEPAVVATGGFMVARCAPPAKYFDVIDALFAGQQAMFESGDFRAWLVQAGAKGGLSRDRVMACAHLWVAGCGYLGDLLFRGGDWCTSESGSNDCRRLLSQLSTT